MKLSRKYEQTAEFEGRQMAFEFAAIARIVRDTVLTIKAGLGEHGGKPTAPPCPLHRSSKHGYRSAWSYLDSSTFELPGLPPVPKKRGRKPTGEAISNAERQRKYRESRKLIQTGERIAATISRLAGDFDLTETQVTRELLRFALCNRNWNETGFPGVNREN